MTGSINQNHVFPENPHKKMETEVKDISE